MAKRRNISTLGAKKKLKTWTIICLIFVCIAALVFRGFLVYIIYPINYQDEIKQNCENYSIDEYFVCALIFAESSFKDDAISNKGAIGLMQIMPDTGEWAAEKIGLEDYSVEMLSDPKININIGCWYLAYLSDRFDSDAKKVLAAYNAGPSNVDEWTTEDGTLGDIPFNETSKYLVRVQRYYEIYRGIYNDF